MAAKRYSAGAIFLQVVPVFANVQRAIEDEAKNIDRALGDQMEKSGEKAGERAGKAASKKMNEELAKGSGAFEREMHSQIDAINRALAGIDTKKLGNNLRRELSQVKRDLAELKDLDLTVDGDFRRFNAGLAEAEGRVRGLRDNAKVVFRADIDNALKGFSKLEAAKEAIEDPVEIEVRVDTGPAERAMSGFERSVKKHMDRAAGHLKGSVNKEVRRLRDELEYLSKLRVGVDISSGALRRELGEINAELKALADDEVDIDVKFDAAQAASELSAFQAQVNALDGQDIDIDVDVDASRAQRALAGLGRESHRSAVAGDHAANSFRSFNIILFAVASAGPALVPILAAIAGGLFALGPAAAVAAGGLGAVLVGFSGLGDALTALQAREDQMAATTASSAKTQENAARQVANARRAAADAIEAALDRQRDANERYRESIEDVRDAELALAEARRDARGQGDDIKDRIADNQLAQDQGLLDVFNATVAYNAVRDDGSATNAEKEQARINLEQARRALEELREEAKELAKEQKRWRKEGVDGTDEVEQAQDRLNDALEAQKDAYEDLRDAAEAVDEARADGARQVADAMRGQAQAMEEVSAQQRNVDAAFDKLGPAGQAFALFLFGLRDEFYAFRDDVQQVLLPAVQQAIESFMGSESGSVARSWLIDMAEGFGEFVQVLSQSIQGPAWLEFFKTMARFGPDIQAAYGQAFISFLEGMASILTTLAPFALEFAEGFAKMMGAFADWAASEEGQNMILRFLEYVREVGPDVLAFIGAFARFALAVGEGLAEWGDVVLEGLTGFLNALANMNPQVLSALVTAIFVLITASQTAYAVMNLIMAAGALFTSTVGLWIFIIVGAVAALVLLYRKNEDFRDFVQKAWKVIQEAFWEAWDKYIKPALMELWDALQQLWDEVLRPFFKWLAPIILWAVRHIIPLLGWVFAEIVTEIADLITDTLIPGLKNFAAAMKWLWHEAIKPVAAWIQAAWHTLWNNHLKPTWERMERAWERLGNSMEWVREHILRPVFRWIANDALPWLERAFEGTIDAIEDIWNGLKRVVGSPIKFVIETILNDGLIAGFNRVAKWVGMDGFNDIPVPGWMASYATGGIMPGYTPGRDVHRFVSPTGGRLELSGGEAIMRPEWTQAIGPEAVHQMNAIARNGGVNAVRKLLGGQAFARGGIFFPLPGGRTGTYPGHDGVDINIGSGWDDYGLPFYSATRGRVTSTGYSRGYGNAIFVASPYGELVYGHAIDNSQVVRPGQEVNPGQMLARIGSTGNSSAPHLHFGFPNGSYSAAMALLAGALDPGQGYLGGGGGRSIPGWLMSIVKDPLGAVKNWITSPLKKAAGYVKDSPVFDAVTKLPLLAAKKVTDKVWDVVPGWVKTAAGWAGDAAEWVVGGVKNAPDVLEGHTNPVVSGAGAVADFLGFARGGILPYNGTMKYDAGGYLPPGLTSVVNLTGKPEPVFTNDQWEQMEGGTGGIHYEPHFEGSDLRPEDVAADLNFTFRKIRRGGKYQEVGQ